MITTQIGRTLPLPCGVNDIKGFTIAGYDYLFLDYSGCKLIKWSECAETIKTISLNRRYRCICYDQCDNCYWAIPECEPCRIYRLDTFFCEVGHLTICDSCQQRPTDICCDNCENGLWVCYPCQLAFVEKCTQRVTWHKNKDRRQINLGVLIQCACSVNCFYASNRQIIAVLSPCGNEYIELCVPKGHKVMGMAPCPCKVGDIHCHFYILLSNDCSRKLTLTEYGVHFFQEATSSCGLCPCPPAPVPCPSPCPHPYPCNGSYEVMHSIALEESGISHILNAEGEKIQKAVAISDNIEDLICVNESVKRTLTQVTLLEGMLYSKLEALVSCDDFCHTVKPPCPAPCPPSPCYE